MGRGRGRGGSRGRGQGSAFSDDDEPSQPPTHRGGSGSTAGGRASGTKNYSSHGKTDLAYTQSVPKFLQQYGHLLQKGDRPKPRAKVDVDEDQEQEGDGDANATLRALEDNPDMAAGVPDAQVTRLKSEAAKEQGNDAFKAKDYESALHHYSEAIKLDNTNSTYYSNRAAVYAHLEDWAKSRDDARTCVSLRGTWAKGWSRLGHALAGLEEWEEAKAAFSRARDLDPDDQRTEKAWQKADYEERQANQSGRVTFKARGHRGASEITGASATPGAPSRSRSRLAGAHAAFASKSSTRDRTGGADCPDAATGGGGSRVQEQDCLEGVKSASASKPQAKKRAVLSFGDSDEDGQDDDDGG